MLDHDSFDVQGALGDRARAAAPAVRLLVAPRPRHDDHAASGGRRTWSRTASIPELLLGGQVRPSAARLGSASAASTCRRSTSAPSSRWCSSCGRRTTRRRPTASSASSCRSRTSRPRSGSGIGKATNGSARWQIRKVIEIPAEPATEDELPPLLKGFKAVPPLVTDINLSLDDQFLYVSCWGTGELRQYDVSDPFNPKLTGSRAHRRHRRAGRRIPTHAGEPLNGGPQMVEVSRDGTPRLPHQLALHAVGRAVLPRRHRGWMAKLDAAPGGGMSFDPRFFLDFGGAAPAPGAARGRRRVV